MKKFWTGMLTGTMCSMLIATLILSAYLRLDSVAEAKENNLSAETVTSKEYVEGKMNTIKGLLDEYFLGDVSEQELVDGMYKGMMLSLDDDYAAYYTVDEMRDFMETNNGKYCGIGTTVSQDLRTGIITIVKPFVNGPAYKAGLLPGDIIYKVDGSEVAGKDLTMVVKDMKGPEGTMVEIAVIREGLDKPKVVKIKRAIVERPTVEFKMLKDKIGYVSIDTFDVVTETQFDKAVTSLEKKGAKGLIIDLRNNGGGDLDVTIAMLDRILPKQLVMYEIDKKGKKEERFAEDNKAFKKPIAILINGQSASASEVFSGALQDAKVATLVGEQSFGKGIVQSVIQLDDGSGVKFTVSEYFTPKGRKIHKIGLTPDVKVELKKELKNKVVIDEADDNQLQKAIQVLKKKIK